MTKADLITKLESLLQHPNIAEINNDVKALQNEYLRILTEIKNEQIKDFVEAGGIRKEYEYKKDADDLKIEKLFEQYKELRKKYDQQKSEEQKKNLQEKKQIIEQINTLIKEEDITKAITTFKELTARWKEIGQVHPDKFRELQNEYSKALENFNYNLRIYKEIKDYDYKKNYENKLAIIEKIKPLAQKDSIKEIDDTLRSLRSEWDEIGPVQQEKWAELRDEYRKTMELVYERLNYLKEKRTQERQENFKLKEAISDKIEAILNELPTTIQGWKNRTEEIKKLQDQWAKINKAEKSKEEQAYTRLRNLSDRFFDLKHDFFSKLKETYEQNKKLKEALVKQAEELKNSTHWKQTTETLINLQKKWKEIGPAAQQVENKLWKQFREACNYFFNAKQLAAKEQEQLYTTNTEQKKKILNDLKSFEPSGNIAKDKEKLIAIKNEWLAVGPALLNERKTLNEEFFKTLDAWFEKIQIDKKEQELIKIQNKIDKLLTLENAEELLKKEIDFFNKKITEQKNEILKLENKLGFLKNAEILKKEVLSKIEEANHQLELLNERIKLYQKNLRNYIKQKESSQTPIA